MDYFGALLTGTRPVTDPTCAASSGVFDIRLGSWAQDYLKALDLPPGLFPEVRPSGTLLGNLTEEAADMTGLPAGLPVFGGIGDNQASFLGSVGDPEETVLVNVGTGGQVSMFSEHFLYDPRLETRPYPGGGFLLACVGLCGGRAYAALEKFFRQVGWELYGMARVAPLFDTLNRLASSVPSGADGLRCEPFFAGTRQQPELRASWTGISLDNFAPAHLARSLLEGMARAFHSGEEVIAALTGRPARRLVGAGNGIRQNPLLAQLLADEFGLPLNVPCHAEEAAQGAALLAGFGAGLLGDLTTAGQLIRYTDPVVGERRS
jgi:sugar (pentulose or hexulose) kinase